MNEKMIKKYMVTTDSEVYAISLVDEPAIESDFVALAKQQPMLFQNEEKHMIYGAALRPNFPIYRYEDGNEFYMVFSKEAVEKMSQDFMTNYRQKSLTLDHKTEATELTIVESWLKADKEYDKSNALGLDNLPIGTWFVGCKVNNIDTWERIKSGELKGFSVEAMIGLEDFAKQNLHTEETNDMNFWNKMKNTLKEIFETLRIEELNNEEGTNANVEQPQTIETPTTEENVNTEETPTNDAVVETPQNEGETVEAPQTADTPTNEETVEQPQPSIPHLDEVIKNLEDEINRLKEANNVLSSKLDDALKQPSTKPVSVHSQGNSTYSQWRETMRMYMR